MDGQRHDGFQLQSLKILEKGGPETALIIPCPFFDLKFSDW